MSYDKLLWRAISQVTKKEEMRRRRKLCGECSLLLPLVIITMSMTPQEDTEITITTSQTQRNIRHTLLSVSSLPLPLVWKERVLYPWRRRNTGSIHSTVFLVVRWRPLERGIVPYVLICFCWKEKKNHTHWRESDVTLFSLTYAMLKDIKPG